MNPIKIIKNRSDIGAGTRGSDMGIDAIEIAAINTENDFSKSYSLEEAVDMAIKTATTKFNETIDICMNLNIDPKNGEQNVRGKIKLPKSLGKNH